MKGGYFVLDCRDHQPTADNTSLAITDEEFKKDFIAAGKSGKPVLFTNFRGVVHRPTFGKICCSVRPSGGINIYASVSTAIDTDFNAIVYVWVYDESTDTFSVVTKTYKLTN